MPIRPGESVQSLKNEYAVAIESTHANPGFGTTFRSFFEGETPDVRRRIDIVLPRIFRELALPAHERLPQLHTVKVSDLYKNRLAQVTHQYLQTHPHFYYISGDEAVADTAERSKEWNSIQSQIAAQVASIRGAPVPKVRYIFDEKDQKHAQQFMEGNRDAFGELHQRVCGVPGVEELVSQRVYSLLAQTIVTGSIHFRAMHQAWSPGELLRVVRAIQTADIQRWSGTFQELLKSDSLEVAQDWIAERLVPFAAQELAANVRKRVPEAYLSNMRDLFRSIDLGNATSLDLQEIVRVFRTVYPEELALEGTALGEMRDRRVVGIEFASDITEEDILQQLQRWPWDQSLPTREQSVVFVDCPYIVDTLLPSGEKMLVTPIDPATRTLVVNGSYSQMISIYQRLFDSNLSSAIRRSNLQITIEHEKVHQVIKTLVSEDPRFIETVYQLLLKNGRSVYTLVSTNKYPSLGGISTRRYVEEELALLWELMFYPEYRERIKTEMPLLYDYAVNVMHA